MAAYERGEMLYDSDRTDAEFYGEAVVPRAFFEREWAPDFEVLEFLTARSRFEQAICIMRRR